MTMVEVTLTERADDIRNSKACWFPFHKQIKNRRSVTMGSDGESWDTYEISNTKLSKSRSIRLCNITSIDNNLNRKELFHHKNDKKISGSISTGTETDKSFLSDESRTTAGTGLSSEGTYNKAPASSSQSHLSCGRNTTIDYSHQGNSIVEKSFIDHTHNRVHKISRSPSRSKTRLISQLSNFRISKGECVDANQLDDDYDGDGSIVAKDPKKGNPSIYRHPHELKYQTEKGLGGWMPAVKLAKIETNCTAKEFWTDEAVEGGAFACTKARKKKIDFVLDKQPRKYADAISENSLDRVNEVSTSSAKMNKTLEQSNEKRVHPFGRIMQFVSQDPEDTNDGAPLRRILCSSVPFRNRNKPMRCQRREGIPQQEGHESVEETARLQEEAPTFYVEVEAMREQLNGIRDLDVIEAENAELDEDIVNARTSSLVDEDFAITGSLERRRKLAPLSKDRASSFHENVGEITDIRRQGENQKQKRKSIVIKTDKRNGSSGDQTLNYKGQIHKSQRNSMIQHSLQAGWQQEKMGRQNKLLSEMVTDRVLAMRIEDEIIPKSMGRDGNYFKINHTTSKFQRESLVTDYQTHERQLETMDQGHLKSCTPPRVIEPPVPASSLNPLNVSELTEQSCDQFASNWKTITVSTKKKNRPAHRNSSNNAIQERDNDEKKGDWQESEIGYDRIPDAALHESINTAFFPRHDYDIEGGKFDENFWKEDNDDLNSAAFEMYCSENDSVFDDLRSHHSTQYVDSKSSKNESKAFEASFQRNFSPNDGTGQYSLRKP